MPYIRQVNTDRQPLTPERVREALTASDGSVVAAARQLGYSRQTVYEWMKAHDIKVERVVREAA